MELLENKNYDDKVQEFIWHTTHVGVAARVPDVGGAVKRGTTGGRGDAGKAVERLRGLAGLVWSSGEFRGLVTEFAAVGRDMFADAAAQVASTASGVEDQARSTDLSSVNPEHISPAVVKEKGTAIAESARKSTYQFRDDLESYLREKFPKQHRDAVVNRMKKVVQDIQENPDFQETVDFIVELMHKYVTKIKDSVVAEGKTVEVKTDENFDIAMKDVQALLMAFADGKPLDPINDALRKVIDDIQSDKDLKEFYDQVTEEFNRLLTDKGYVTSDAADARVHQLYERSQELLHEKQDHYQPDVEHLFAEVRFFIDAMRNDKNTQRVIEASKKVYSDLVLTDNNGNFRGFRKRILWDMIEVIFPRFIDEIKFIPLPRIEYQDRDFDLILENVVLESEHFLPTRTVLEAFTRLELTNTYHISSSHKTTTHLHIDSINLFIRDASFIIRKKTGLIPLSDRGFIDMFMTHNGASADVILESSSSDDDDDVTGDSYFHIKSVNVTIHNFSYNYHAYHTWAAALLSPIIKPIIKKLVASILQQKIREAVEMADREIHAAAERMRVASIATKDGGSIEAWIRAVLSRPPGSGRRHGGAEWRIVVDEPELFPGEHPPGSMLAKLKRAEERVEAGREEEGWRNSIFVVRA
ncbi:hypothetical protein BDD12DRAFT_758363 [Trichophaea hybrida]|nr:hypothetical protein BDD12DRAFT_758363 [Trichophaea hybrida]